MKTDHKNICKFDSPDDTNYLKLRNALVGAVGTILHNGTSNIRIRSEFLTLISLLAHSKVSNPKQKGAMEEVRTLRSYLAVSDSPDEYYTKLSGSCEWIDARDDFKAWRDCTTNLVNEELDPADNAYTHPTLKLFWAHASLGTGKTVLASHVVSQLQRAELECAYFYFHAGDKASRTLGAFLRSMAYQMALANGHVRENLYKLCQDGSTFDLDDSWTIWTKIFKKGVFLVS